MRNHVAHWSRVLCSPFHFSLVLTKSSPQNLTVDPSFKNKPRILAEGCASSRGCSEFAGHLAAILPTTAALPAVSFTLSVCLFHTLTWYKMRGVLSPFSWRGDYCLYYLLAILSPWSSHFTIWKTVWIREVSCPYNGLCCYGELLVLLFGALGSLAGLGSSFHIVKTLSVSNI